MQTDSQIKKIYIIGSLREYEYVNSQTNSLRKEFPKINFWDQWTTVGPEADTFLLEYTKKRNMNYKQALTCDAALHTFALDKKHIDESDALIMIMPCGKSGHMEAGYAIGCKKPVFVLFKEEPDRFDLMYNFFGADNIFFNFEELIFSLKKLI